MEHEFEFSVVIPVYNAEEYLEEAVRSVMGQTTGFDGIQLILVNDGSTDGSRDICLRHSRNHPENIVFVDGENHGVSAARNTGLRHASGRYVNFLDADDAWPPDAMETVRRFMDGHPEINVAACMMEYFGRMSGTGHPLNWKFTGDGVVDIMENPAMIQMHIASCFIRRNALDGTGFEEGLRYGEDSLLVNRLIMRDMKYGVLESVHYMYRKRSGGGSALDGCVYDRTYYTDTPARLIGGLLSAGTGRDGIPCPYAAHAAMYDMQWRIKRRIPEGVLTDSEADAYRKELCGFMGKIPDSVIMAQRNIWSEHKMLALSMKRGADISERLVQSGSRLYHDSVKVFSLSNGSAVKLSRVSADHGMLHMEGLINIPVNPDLYELHAEDPHGGRYAVHASDFPVKEKECVYGHYYFDRYFTADVPVPCGKVQKVSFMFSYRGAEPTRVSIGLLGTCRINMETRGGYLRTGDNIIEKRKDRIIVRNMSRKLILKKESGCILNALSSGFPEVLMYRAAAWIHELLGRKETWIISDRDSTAGDNGEEFFRYLVAHPVPGVRPYFALSGKSPDFKRMKAAGRCLDTDSFWYRLKFLTAGKIISSHADRRVTDPFGAEGKFLKDLYRHDFIFLQHGIIKDDLSSWLNRADKNIDMFITSAVPEYESVIGGKYGYGPETVKLTGMPRYDRLARNSGACGSRKIAVAPTWRKGLCRMDAGFSESSFFRFYDGLMKDGRLNAKMKELGYTGMLYLHPMMEGAEPFFTGHGAFSVHEGNADYQRMLDESCMLVTDYSSLSFDFAYIGRPVVYAQPDPDAFFMHHTYDRGYFDYAESGFGKVTRDVRETTDEIIRLMEQGCHVDAPYGARADAFFGHDGGCRSERILGEILRMDGGIHSRHRMRRREHGQKPHEPAPG